MESGSMDLLFAMLVKVARSLGECGHVLMSQLPWFWQHVEGDVSIVESTMLQAAELSEAMLLDCARLCVRPSWDMCDDEAEALRCSGETSLMQQHTRAAASSGRGGVLRPARLLPDTTGKKDPKAVCGIYRAHRRPDTFAAGLEVVLLAPTVAAIASCQVQVVDLLIKADQDIREVLEVLEATEDEYESLHSDDSFYASDEGKSDGISFLTPSLSSPPFPHVAKT